MKKNKAIIAVMALLLGGLFTITSCTKEGPQGPAGTNGTNGVDGNANVKVYNFPADSISGGAEISLSLSGLTSGYLDSSLVLVYFVDGANGLWYGSPGLGANHAYQTRWYLNSSSVKFKAADPDGSSYSGSTLHFDKFKVVVAKGSEFFGKKEPVDFTNYAATMRYFGLKE
jgi:hypothetical protein